jgi:hypothetical protein
MAIDNYFVYPIKHLLFQSHGQCPEKISSCMFILAIPTFFNRNFITLKLYALQLYKDMEWKKKNCLFCFVTG